MQIKGLTVSQVVRLAKEALESQFFNLWVEGEISDLTDRGYIFFTLKDERASIRAVMYRSARRFLRFPLKEGMKVVCRGRLSIYEPRGDFQIIVEEVVPKGLGELQAAFEELKRRLEAEGLFNDSRKKPLPEWIEHMAVVTSPTGAAVRDVVVNSIQRAPWVRITIYPVHVQGQTAAREIANAIAELNRLGGFDIIVLARGGGSLQDLWAFNEEIVARAIAASKIPVVSAVGHERDYTIADFAADHRVSTPTAVARLLVSHRDVRLKAANAVAHMASAIQSIIQHKKMRIASALPHIRRVPGTVHEHIESVADLFDRIVREADRAVRLHERHLTNLVKGLIHQHPRRRMAHRLQQLQTLRRRLVEGATGFIEIERTRLAGLHSRLNDLSPLGVLARGYSIVLKSGRVEVVKSYDQVREGERLDVALARGGLVCEVVEGAPDIPKQLPRTAGESDER